MARRVAKKSSEGGPTSHPQSSNVFGAQSRWSSLLVERERVEGEIKHAQLFLEQLRKDTLCPKTALPTRRHPTRKRAANNAPQMVRSALDKHTLEQSVLMWLDGLNARLKHLAAEAEKLLDEGEQLSESPEEAIYTLLRGAR